MGAGIGIGSFLSGLGKGYLERKDRQDRLKTAATQAGLKQLVGMMDDPSFDPAAKQDALGTYFTILGDMQGGKSASKGANGKKNDPMQHMQELVGGMFQKTYPEGQAQAGAPPVLSPRPDASGGREELAPGSAGKMERKGPFRGTGEIREQIEQDERRKAQIREGEALKRQQLAAQLKLAEKNAEERQRKANYDTMIGTGMDKAEAFAMSYPGRANPFIQRGAQAGPKAGTPVKVTLPDGSTIDAWEDKYTRKFTKLDGTEIPPNTIKAVNPKAAAGDKGLLGEMEAAQAKLDNPQTPASERKAAQLFMDSQRHRDNATTLRIEQSRGGGSDELTDDDLRTLAERDIASGGTQKPSLGLSAKDPTRKRYNKMLAEVARERGGGGNAAAAGASFKASQATLTKLSEVRGQMKGAEKGTIAEIERVQALSKTVNRSDMKSFNRLQQFLDANLSSSPDLARFREALLAARYRYNSMITSLKSGGTATNAVRAETAEEIMDRTFANGTIQAAAEEMKVGVRNVMKGMDEAVDGVREELVALGGGGGDKRATLPKARKGGEMATKEIMKKYSDAHDGNRDEALKALKAAGYR